jgi:hypothetical protein
MRAALRMVWWMAGCVLLLAVPARAGDCASPDDCSSIPDNGTKAACVGGVIAGCSIYERTRRKKDDDPEFGEGRADNEDAILEGSGAQPSSDTPSDGQEHKTTDTSPAEKKAPDIMNKPLGGDDIF